MTAAPAPSARSPLRPVLLFALALAAVDAAAWAERGTWERYSPDDYTERVDGCRRRAQDFVLVGGSPVAEGLDPDLVAGAPWQGRPLGPGYALGLSGGTTSEVYHAAVHGCASPPRLVVYGVTASDLNDNRQEPHGADAIMDVQDWYTWASERPESRDWVTRKFVEGRVRRLWNVYRYRHGMRMAAAAFAAELVPGCCPESAREAAELRRYAEALQAGNGYAPAAGFVTARYDLRKAAGAEFPPYTFLNGYRTGEHLRYLDKLADWTRDHGADLALLDMPVTADLEAAYPDAVAEYQRVITAFATGRGVPILRGTRAAVGLDDSSFADTTHLNGAGARKLSLWLRDRLADLGGGRP